MSRKSELAADIIIDLLLQLPNDDRALVFSEVKNNGIFCVECGVGEENTPNRGCQCWNDE